VKAKVADSHGDALIHESEYASGDVSSDGSLVNLGQKVDDLYDYTAPDGTEYMRNISYQDDVLGPDGNGKENDARTIINFVTHTYSQAQAKGISVSNGPAPNLNSSPSQVQQALQSGQVTQKGTTTVNGTQAIALAITVPPSVPGAGSVDLILYVDAQTYQPLRMVEVFDGHPALIVADWIPATPDNIAQAEEDSIPAGYTKVGNVY
jgi:hypothetical protein